MLDANRIVRCARVAAMVACLVLAAACGDGSSGGGNPSQPAACAGLAGVAGERTISIESGGLTREFRLFVPESNDPTSAVPLVLNFHGLGSNARGQEVYSGMVEKATAEGFITAAGEGIGKSWNTGEVCCAPANQQGVDDVQFTRDMVARIASEYCIDAQRIFSTGMSNGAFMSNRLACDAADLIAAIAPVAGIEGLVGCAPSRPVPILMFNGTLDPLVPYAGAGNSFVRWQGFNACSGDAATTYASGDASCATYEECAGDATTTLCTIDGGGHTWPGTDILLPQFGATSHDIDATDAMWDFFVAHPKP
jgi:polyhydroxybutyrate depolymerase